MPRPDTASREHPASRTSRALAEHAASFCVRYLPHGHREDRYWRAGGVHGEPGRTLWVLLAPPGRTGRWHDTRTGQRGDLLDLLRIRLGGVSLGRAIDEARVFLDAAGPAPATPALPSQQDPRQRAGAPLRLWELCQPLPGSHAERYLRALGIVLRGDHPSLRFHPRLFHRDANDAHRELPALVAAVTNDAGDLTGVERIYLDPDRPARADIPRPSRSLGRTYAGRVAFGRSGPVLLVAQGIETALALRTARPGLPAAATLAPTNLGVFVPPPGVARLLIARDRGDASAEAARRLLEHCRRRALAATVLAPRLGDFSRDLLAHGPEALAERLRADAPPVARA